ncbi:hypothetical protein AVEN_167479-1 [Araneus ventricosus]|uniref:Uncharacterized protein n=1 Tax=Araneus ventricosus TaxID=182803 RepID=A0A4Y2TTT7_ARAVE|nr:hypothetical protein AVEN_167479-1 [Araneus ventricosus]
MCHTSSSHTAKYEHTLPQFALPRSVILFPITCRYSPTQEYDASLYNSSTDLSALRVPPAPVVFVSTSRVCGFCMKENILPSPSFK